MFVPRALGMLLLATAAWAQVEPPPTCQGVVLDHERFRAHAGRITLHVKYHEGRNVFDSRYVLHLRRPGPADAACTDGDVLDYFIAELVKQRQSLGPQ